jgi:hypothetical protein
MAKMSRASVKEHETNGGLECALQKINDHQSIFQLELDLSIPGFLPREWVLKVVWKWGDGRRELTAAYDDTTQEAFPERKGFLRGRSTAMFKFKQEAAVGGVPQTKVTYTVQADVGGAIPKWVQNMQGVSELM